VHPTLFCVKCRKQPMLCSRRLLPKLSASIAGKGLVPFLDQLVLLENTQLRSCLAWLSAQWRVCGMLRQCWGNDLIEAQPEGWNNRLGQCGGRGFSSVEKMDRKPRMGSSTH
jgi:hypothetical protein